MNNFKNFCLNLYSKWRLFWLHQVEDPYSIDDYICEDSYTFEIFKKGENKNVRPD